MASNNGGNSSRLRSIEKITEHNTWRNNCRKKRHARTSAAPNKSSPFQLDLLPLNLMVTVASHLPFEDFKRIGFISKNLNVAQRITRNSRKSISVDLLRRLFPEEPFPMIDGSSERNGGPNDYIENNANNNKDDDEAAADNRSGSDDDEGEETIENNSRCVGMLQVMRPLRKTLRSSPPRNIREVDLSEFSAFRESHFVELLDSVNNGRLLFSEVRRLNVQGCVIEIKDMAYLAQLMPKIWFIRCSARTLVLPESTQRTLSADQLQQLRRRVENFAQVSSQFTRKHLWFLAQLTELFPELEMVQLDN